MKLFTRSTILKSTTVEITSPKLLESPKPGRDYKKNTKYQGILPEFPVLTMPGEDLSEQILEQDTIISEAQTEANRILAEARKKAEEIVRTAHQDSENLRKNIEEAVRQEIIPLAQAEGLEKGLKQAAKEAVKLKQEAKGYLELARKALKNEYERVDKELISLCLQICEKIIFTSLRLDPQKLLSIIRNLTLMPREKEGMKLHLSLQDWEWYQDLPDEDKPPYPVIADESLNAGDSYLECREGLFDARIKSQLETLEQYLIEELSHGRLDSLSTND
jgi:flagellar assembly protein FliH